jgi:hypothetical protein
MRVLMGLAAYNGVADWIEKVEQEYEKWGGEDYYLSQPPQNIFKRQILQAALRIGGPQLVGSILRIKNRIGKKSKINDELDKIPKYKKTMQTIIEKGESKMKKNRRFGKN